MLHAGNREIVSLAKEIDYKFNSILRDCAEFGEGNQLPGVSLKKTDLRQSKIEFDNRVRDWLVCVDSTSSKNILRPQTPPALPNESFESLQTRSEAYSHSSSLTLKQKERHVKLRVAMAKKEKEAERVRLAEETERVLFEADKRLESVKREVAQLKQKAKRDAEMRERSWEVQLAKVEAEAWTECSSSTDGSGRSGDRVHVKELYNGVREKYSPVELSKRDGCGSNSKGFGSVKPVAPAGDIKDLQNILRLLNSPSGQRGQDLRSEAGREGGALIGVPTSVNNVKSNDRPIGSSAVAPGFGAPQSECAGQLGFTPALFDRPAVLPTSEPVSDAPGMGSSRQAPLSFGVRNVQDYPPPRPVIQAFDGDPLGYWPFIRSFETHISSKLPSDSAKLVYLLQHCSPSVRKNLEHFSRDTVSGYRFARESLYSDYGQPHIVAHCCEQNLLKAPRLRVIEATGLKTLAVLMEKCLSMLKDIDDFATLNSLGTIRRITEKFPEQMQRDWVSWSYKHFKQADSQAKFPELVEFVREQSDEANSLYGKVFYGMSRQCNTQQQGFRKATVLNTVTATTVGATSECSRESERKRCPLCEGNHKLGSCDRFLGMKLQRRFSFLARKRRCFRCLEAGHMIDKCSSRQGCTVEGCSDTRHHTLLHRFERNQLDNCESVVCGAALEDESGVNREKPYFMTVPVKLEWNKKEVFTYALLDTGSQRSFCDQKLADALGADGPAKQIPLCTLSSASRSDTVFCREIDLNVCGLDVNRNAVKLSKVLTISEIPLRAKAVPKRMDRFPHLEGITMSELADKKVGLLIGLDAFTVFRPLETRFGPSGTPDAIRTILGWTLFGPSLSLDHVTGDNVGMSFPSMHATLADDVEADSESPLRNPLPGELRVPNSREDRAAFKKMKNSVKMVEGHFQLPLLWKEEGFKLPSNRKMVENRLESLRKRLSKDKNLHKRYVEVMEGYIQKGYAELADAEEDSKVVEWFLPHFPVLNPRKPEKLRIVFDCAAKSWGISLNDALAQGPDLMNNLVGVLSRFRVELVALVADIKEMFHQVKVDPVDRSFLKFLWWPDGDMSQRPRVYRMTVHLFGAASSPSCSSFCLKQVAVWNDEVLSSVEREAIERSFYVDDCLVSVATEEEAIRLMEKMRSALLNCGFQLTKWTSNRRRVVECVPEEERSQVARLQSLGEKVDERVLGVHWDLSSDDFRIQVNIPEKPFTKRGILSMSHSIFDPLGFVAPVLVEAKLLLRELKELDWDEVISDEQIERWKQWLSSLRQLENVKIRRCFKSLELSGQLTYELHHFADASTVAYGAVSYLRIVDENFVVRCSFVMGKSHLAPTRPITVPRLELLAAVTALRLDKAIKRELSLPFSKTYFWSDSTVVIQSIYNSRKRFPVFVANRLAEIERDNDVEDWRYVPSGLNPADEVSRGVTAEVLADSAMWLKGPEFLLKPSEEWPKNLERLSKLPNEFPLLERKVDVVQSLFSSEPGPEAPTDRFVAYYSSLHRLKKASYEKFSRVVEVGDLCVAEERLLSYEQRRRLPELMKALRAKKPLSSRNCPQAIKRVNPFLENDVIRVGGRLHDAQMRFEVKHPVVLPSDSHLTDLVIEHYHRRIGHAGLTHTFSAVRERFWLLRGSSRIRKVLGNCVVCRRVGTSPAVQQMANLPDARLQVSQSVFFHTGCDCFGPFLVKQGRSLVKRWGCIFTCMTVRAVHLEVLHSLSTDSFISALRRFIGRRGKIGHLYSDNGSNFVGANRVLKEALKEWNMGKISNFLLQNEIEWSYNTPLASHFGGCWERLIRSVRRTMASFMPRATFTEEGLVTLFAEAEAIINSRPLTPVSFVDELERPLSPNDLLVLRPDVGLPPARTTNSDLVASKSWRQVQAHADLFWKRWVREYLPTLRIRSKWHDVKRNVSVDAVVIVVDESTPRSQWPMARVVKTFPDAGGLVRSAVVRGKFGEFKRPVTKMCVIVPAAFRSSAPAWISSV